MRIRKSTLLSKLAMSGFAFALVFGLTQTAFAAEPAKFETIQYSGLRQRLVLRAEGNISGVPNRNPEMTVTLGASYEPELAPTEPGVGISKGQFFRVINSRESQDYKAAIGTQISLKETDYRTYFIVMIPLDSHLRVIGPAIELAAKAKPDSELSEFKAYTNDPLLRGDTLTYKMAQSGDTLLNLNEAISLSGKKIPAYNTFVVVDRLVQDKRFTFVDRYTLTLKLKACGANESVECLVRISNDGYIKDPSWVLFVAPQNRRIKKIGSVEIHY